MIDAGRRTLSSYIHQRRACRVIRRFCKIREPDSPRGARPSSASAAWNCAAAVILAEGAAKAVPGESANGDCPSVRYVGVS
jgi:hypothetical protein